MAVVNREISFSWSLIMNMRESETSVPQLEIKSGLLLTRQASEILDHWGHLIAVTFTCISSSEITLATECNSGLNKWWLAIWIIFCASMGKLNPSLFMWVSRRTPDHCHTDKDYLQWPTFATMQKYLSPSEVVEVHFQICQIWQKCL